MDLVLHTQACKNRGIAPTDFYLGPGAPIEAAILLLNIFTSHSHHHHAIKITLLLLQENHSRISGKAYSNFVRLDCI